MSKVFVGFILGVFVEMEKEELKRILNSLVHPSSSQDPATAEFQFQVAILDLLASCS